MRVVCSSMLLVLTACPFGGSTLGDPCSDDANACSDGGVLEIDASCTLDDPLQLELGEGEGAFQPLAPGTAPMLVSGLQGGTHFVLGVGIDNPSPDHLAFEVEVVLSADLGDGLETVGERTVVYTGALVDYDSGRADLLDLVVVPDVWPTEGERWISASVRDACDRRGSVDHRID